jgi:two-component system chemotaxis response regulator CheY
MGQILRNLLTLIGFKHVECVTDGATALARLREQAFGLVMSDWNMQPMSGLKLLQEVRADPMLERLPFVMVTAESTLANVVTAKEAGVSNYIVKPFNGNTLKDKINTVLGRDSEAS